MAAAQRMYTAGTVGDAVCSLSAVGEPDPGLLPEAGRIGVGSYRGYWCLIW
ncbi:hypothetical protein [Streptomyces sp. NPDC126514]|uniref:hypothetical protein n=1 Tax=Streptomyces sp. NPDC126514 TaxID=3155210 RepID=UPI003320D01F